jgi:hypothetical protein
MPDIQDAVSRTLDPLGRDAIREDVGLESDSNLKPNERVVA